MADKRVKWQEVSMPRLINPAGSQAAHWNHCQPPYLSTGLILPNRREDLWATHGCLSWARKHLPLDLLSGRSVSVWQPCQAFSLLALLCFAVSCQKRFHPKSSFQEMMMLPYPLWDEHQIPSWLTHEWNNLKTLSFEHPDFPTSHCSLWYLQRGEKL